MSIAIIRYPASNCDFDTLHYFEDSFFIWHTTLELSENILGSLKLLVIPGGFAFGDRVYDKATDNYHICPGKMAIESPVTKIIMEAAHRNIPILGICNGFQILVQLELLPGKLLLNDNKKFTCKKVKVNIHYDRIWDNYKTELFIANSYGKYKCSEKEYESLVANDQIFMSYDEDIPEVGSLYYIAGICNRNRTVFGLMPHPERNVVCGKDFKPILYEMLGLSIPETKVPKMQAHFEEKISEIMQSEHVSYKSTRK